MQQHSRTLLIYDSTVGMCFVSHLTGSDCLSPSSLGLNGSYILKGKQVSEFNDETRVTLNRAKEKERESKRMLVQNSQHTFKSHVCSSVYIECSGTRKRLQTRLEEMKQKSKYIY